MKCSIKLVLSDPSLHPSPLTWGIPLFATRSLHRWLKLGDRKIIRAWAVLTLDSSCVLVSPLNTSSRGQTTERTLREHSICFLSYWLFIFRSVECIMNGFSALREWEVISLALGDREDMSKRCSGGRARTTGRHVWRWGLRCGTGATASIWHHILSKMLSVSISVHFKGNSLSWWIQPKHPWNWFSIGWNNVLFYLVSHHLMTLWHLNCYYGHLCTVNYALYNIQQKL